MAKKAAAPDRVCLNHPTQPATSRCAQCAKPICARCVVARDGYEFCSPACADARAEFVLRSQAFGASTKRGESSLTAWLFRGVIVLLVLGIVYYVFIYWGVRTPGDVVEMLGNMFGS